MGKIPGRWWICDQIRTRIRSGITYVQGTVLIPRPKEETPAEGSPVDKLIKDIDNIPFYDELDATLQAAHGMGIKELISDNRIHDIVSAIVNPSGMNYGNLPKGLLTFHRYTDGVRTPLEEQLVEGDNQPPSTARYPYISPYHPTTGSSSRKSWQRQSRPWKSTWA